MNKTINVGGENFIRLRQSGSYYVDKTEIIYDLFHNANNSVSVFTRPRRFGKTLMLSMISSFFDIDKKEFSSTFDDLAIRAHEAFCQENMNQYPVLFISLKDVEGRNFKLAFDKLKAVIADWCKEHSELEKNPSVTKSDTEIFHRLIFKTAGEEEIQNSLKTVCSNLYKVGTSLFNVSPLADMKYQLLGLF